MSIHVCRESQKLLAPETPSLGSGCREPCKKDPSSSLIAVWTLVAVGQLIRACVWIPKFGRAVAQLWFWTELILEIRSSPTRITNDAEFRYRSCWSNGTSVCTEIRLPKLDLSGPAFQGHSRSLIWYLRHFSPWAIWCTVSEKNSSILLDIRRFLVPVVTCI